ncbi:MAG: hypothetical protein IKJ24_05025 [Clostridia bacterium]|nr:hypothetical protein [Clostridia bacterium]
MYVRPPASNHGGVRIPENYSGNAFSRQPIYTQMPPPIRTQSNRQEDHQYGRPMDLDIPPEEAREDLPLPAYDPVEEESEVKPNEKATEHQASIFSSLLPRGALSTHFPFGHGIGSEELLILAVMLLVFLSGNETGELDSEFILLLGLLLFAG